MSDTQDIEPTAWGRPPPGRPPFPGWGRPPTGVWPPCPPGPPGPWPGGLFRLEQCWDDVKATRAFLIKMLKDIIADDPSIIGLAQPIVGVTDGSGAQPGMVGEVILFEGSFAYNDGYTTGPVSMGALPAGDWNVWGWGGFSTVVTGAQFFIDPLPAGFIGNPSAALIGTGGPEIDPELLVLPSTTAVVRTSAPSLMAMMCKVWTATGTGPGTMNVLYLARRMR